MQFYKCIYFCGNQNLAGKPC